MNEKWKFSVSEDGEFTFETYINNLDPNEHRELYIALQELLGWCLPHLESAWTYGSQVHAY